MRTLFYLLLCICFISCEKESELIMSDAPIEIRNNESDLNFLLRATHPKQEVEFVLPDGSVSTHSFHGHVNVFSSGKANGKVHFGSVRLGWRFQPDSARWECEDEFLILVINGEIQALEAGKKGSKGSAVLSVQSPLNDTDTPDCVIWEIDSGGGEISEGSFEAEGNIFISNSQCGEDPR